MELCSQMSISLPEGSWVVIMRGVAKKWGNVHVSSENDRDLSGTGAPSLPSFHVLEFPVMAD